jgi:hypothetical protein
MDIRQTGISGFPSSAPKLLEQIQDRSIVDYAIFDLGDGNQWLSTRLYLFTVILHRMRGLKSIVFVDTYQTIRHHFVAIAEPTQVQYTLASRYPWLERTFARVYGNLPNLAITSINGTIEQWNALQLVGNFLQDNEIQQVQPPPVAPGNRTEWVYLDRGNIWEHADWLDTDKVEEILGEVLKRSRVSRLDLQGKSTIDQAKLILSFKEPFVVVVDQDRRFERLIDRQRLADEITRGLVYE